jgi:hypothetical protein
MFAGARHPTPDPRMWFGRHARSAISTQHSNSSRPTTPVSRHRTLAAPTNARQRFGGCGRRTHDESFDERDRRIARTRHRLQPVCPVQSERGGQVGTNTRPRRKPSAWMHRVTSGCPHGQGDDLADRSDVEARHESADGPSGPLISTPDFVAERRRRRRAFSLDSGRVLTRPRRRSAACNRDCDGSRDPASRVFCRAWRQRKRLRRRLRKRRERRSVAG